MQHIRDIVVSVKEPYNNVIWLRPEDGDFVLYSFQNGEWIPIGGKGGSSYLGVAKPNTMPIDFEEGSFYLAGNGTYINFGNLTVNIGEFATFQYKEGVWVKETVLLTVNMDKVFNTDGKTLTEILLEINESIPSLKDTPLALDPLNTDPVEDPYATKQELDLIKGDIAIREYRTDILLHPETDFTLSFALDVNLRHIFKTPLKSTDELIINLIPNNPNTGVMEIFIVQFTIAEAGASLNITGATWAREDIPELEAGMTYEIVVVDGMATYQYFAITVTP